MTETSGAFSATSRTHNLSSDEVITVINGFAIVHDYACRSVKRSFKEKNVFKRLLPICPRRELWRRISWAWLKEAKKTQILWMSIWYHLSTFTHLRNSGSTSRDWNLVIDPDPFIMTCHNIVSVWYKGGLQKPNNILDWIWTGLRRMTYNITVSPL